MEVLMLESGWYDDPVDSEVIRYFDGESWTGRTKPKPGLTTAETSPNVASQKPGFDRRLLFAAPCVVGVVLLAVGLSSLRSSGGASDRVAGPSTFSDTDSECGDLEEDALEIDLDNDGRLERIRKTFSDGGYQNWEVAAHDGGCGWYQVLTLTSTGGEPVESGDLGIPIIFDWCVNTTGQQPVVLEMYQEQTNEEDPVHIFDHYFQNGSFTSGQSNQIDDQDIGELTSDCPTLFSGE